MIDQGELFAIPSPCRRICELNNRGYCKGCFRSRAERLNWLQYSDFQRQLIINLCEKRRLKVLAARNHTQQTDDDEYLPPQLDMFERNTPDVSVLSAIEPTTEQPTTALSPTAEDAPAMVATVTAEPDQSSLFRTADEPPSSDTAAKALSTAQPQPDQSALFTEDSTPADHSQANKVKTARRKTPRASKTTDDQQIDLFS